MPWGPREPHTKASDRASSVDKVKEVTADKAYLPNQSQRLGFFGRYLRPRTQSLLPVCHTKASDWASSVDNRSPLAPYAREPHTKASDRASSVDFTHRVNEDRRSLPH